MGKIENVDLYVTGAKYPEYAELPPPRVHVQELQFDEQQNTQDKHGENDGAKEGPDIVDIGESNEASGATDEEHGLFPSIGR